MTKGIFRYKISKNSVDDIALEIEIFIKYIA